MKVCVRTGLVALASVLFLLSVCGLLILPVVAGTLPVWEGDVSSTGASISSSVLSNDVVYRIVATEVWFYQGEDDNLAADAMYYTNDSSNSIQWGDYAPAPGGGSFLQINAQNVSWGPFSNGNSGDHTYTYYVTGTGAPLSFRIMDWFDGDLNNNFCHLHVRIYREVTVGGRVADSVLGDLTGAIAVGAAVFAGLVTVPVVSRCRRVHTR